MQMKIVYKTGLRNLFSILFFALTANIATAQIVKGKVTDANTGEPLVGATVKLDGTKFTTLVKLDGTFSFTKLPVGTYKVSVTYQGYKVNTTSTEVTVAGTETKTVDVVLESKTTELQSVTISTNKDKDAGARRLEKAADPVLNILSSKTIELLPDITVANAMQRVSGVTIEKSGSGEARYPIIRGMEKRYINTLVNGIKIPSPDNKNRFIPLDLFPSELLERLEVIKSLTPSMEGDAIGGTINLVMKDAPKDKILHANIAFGYNNILNEQPYSKFDKSSINKQSPSERNGLNYSATLADFPVGMLHYSEKKSPINTTIGLTVGNRFGKEKKLGFIISGSYQNIFRGTQSNFLLPAKQPGRFNLPSFAELEDRRYSVQSQRVGANSKIDYKFNEKNKISLSNMYVRLDDYQTRVRFDTIALNSLVDNFYRSTWQYQSIFNTNLQGNHTLNSGLKIDWNLVYSKAQNDMPDRAEYYHEYPVTPSSTTYDKFGTMQREWLHNTDKDLAGYLNFTNSFKINSSTVELKFGAMLRNKTRDNYYDSYTLNGKGGNPPPLFTTLDSAKYVTDPKPKVNGNDYQFTENVGAGFVQAKVQITKKLEVLGGFRIESTYQNYATALSDFKEAKSGTIKYTDVLPSLQFKYDLGKNQVLRAAYYKATSRPGFAELIPDGTKGEFFQEEGDPIHLDHAQANNLDLRFEKYSKAADQILVGVFYKNIINPIEITAYPDSAANRLVLQPKNGNPVNNYGVELVYTKYFGVFGVSGNYTYTNSKVTNDNMSFVDTARTIGASAVTNVTRLVSETRPLQGQSNHIGNLSLIYKNPKIGFDFQLAFVYTGERINYVSPSAGLHYWQAPTTQLDLSFQKKIVKHLSFYGKINNLTNAPFELYLKIPYNDIRASLYGKELALQNDPANKIVIQKDFYKTTFLFGLRLKL